MDDLLDHYGSNLPRNFEAQVNKIAEPQLRKLGKELENNIKADDVPETVGSRTAGAIGTGLGAAAGARLGASLGRFGGLPGTVAGGVIGGGLGLSGII